MSVTVYVPRDSSALSLGAEKVAGAIAAEADRRNIGLRLVRNGSRGMFSLEPMVEVETARRLVAYSPVTSAEIPGLFDSGFLDSDSPTAGKHRLSLGLTEEIGYLKRQERLTFAR